VTGAVLDAGALIAVERGGRRAIDLVTRAVAQGWPIVVPAGCVAQAWRDPRRQARLARLLRLGSTEIVPLDDHGARLVGTLLRASGTTDVVDAHVAVVARQRRLPILTSDPGDLLVLDPGATVVEV
jgi:hypothetical protein